MFFSLSVLAFVLLKTGKHIHCTFHTETWFDRLVTSERKHTNKKMDKMKRSIIIFIHFHLVWIGLPLFLSSQNYHQSNLPTHHHKSILVCISMTMDSDPSVKRKAKGKNILIEKKQHWVEPLNSINTAINFVKTKNTYR